MECFTNRGYGFESPSVLPKLQRWTKFITVTFELMKTCYTN